MDERSFPMIYNATTSVQVGTQALEISLMKPLSQSSADFLLKDLHNVCIFVSIYISAASIMLLHESFAFSFEYNLMVIVCCIMCKG
jgi:hypothetical protein